VTNFASAPLRDALAKWGYDVRITPVDEFMLAGGAVKCLCLIGQQTFSPPQDCRIDSPIRHTHIQLQGHLLDSGLMNRLFDTITDGGGTFRVEQFTVGQRHDQVSTSSIRVTAPSEERLDLIINRLQPLGAVIASEPTDARLETVEQEGVAPTSFYSTTIYPTDVHVGGNWIRASGQHSGRGRTGHRHRWRIVPGPARATIGRGALSLDNGIAPAPSRPSRLFKSMV
jgi:hypothetical protein